MNKKKAGKEVESITALIDRLAGEGAPKELKVCLKKRYDEVNKRNKPKSGGRLRTGESLWVHQEEELRKAAEEWKQ